MTWICVWLGICLGSVIMLNLRSIQHLRRIQRLEDKDIIHAARLNLQQVRIEELEEELNKLKKELNK